MRSPSSGQGGFTLLELILVVGIFGIVMGISYQVLDTTIEAERRVTKNTRSGKVGQGILTIIRRDLHGTVYRGLGIDVFRGIDGGQGEEAEDSLHFLTTAPVPVPLDEPLFWTEEVASVGYELKPGPDGLGTLFRRVKWEVYDDPLDGGQYYPLYNRVKGIEFRYLDAVEWQEEWDASTLIPEPNRDYFPFEEDPEDPFDPEGDGEEDEGDPPPDPDDPLADEELPLPLPRAVEVVVYLAVGDERGLYTDQDGKPIIERVSTVVPLVATEILIIEDPEALADPGQGN